jgi:hypothetical protein
VSPAKKVAKKTVKNAAKKVVRKSATKAVKKSGTKAAKKSAPKAVKKSALKVVKKSAPKAVKKSANKTRKPSLLTAVRAPRVTRQTPREAAKQERRGRASRRMAHVAERMGTTDLDALAVAMRAALQRASAARAPVAAVTRDGRRRGARLRLQATNNNSRWVPIGPSVVRRGQAEGRPRVTGRVRDIEVTADGMRAYAATGKAGVWYTEDAGASWRPVGGWVTSPALVGGASTDLSCGCLLVSFGVDAATDYVMVGTGELASGSLTKPGVVALLNFGGRGVLAGRGPAAVRDDQSPYERETGVALLENAGIYRLVRDPANRAHANVATDGDRVLAATTKGLFRGVRSTIGGVQQWTWTRITAIDTLLSGVVRSITDVQWVPVAGSVDGRVLVAVHRQGVAWSDAVNVIANWSWISGLNLAIAGLQISGRHSLSTLNTTSNAIYVLVGVTKVPAVAATPDEPRLYRIPTVTQLVVGAVGGPGAAVRIAGVPGTLWGTQVSWDQALCVERVGAVDRVWMGGSTVQPFVNADFAASLYCFDVIEAGIGAPRLAPAVGVSRSGAPPLGDGADTDGLIGNNIHADVHAIRAITLASGARHVWVTCDGGVYVSEQGGRVNTFQSRGNGLAAIESGFMAMHPTSSHFCALGAQDNGVQVRSGDTMWEVIQVGDGGGVMFHPRASQLVMAQYTSGSWRSSPTAGFTGPIDRQAGGGINTNDRESKLAEFYSGCDTIAVGAAGARVAIGTDRVWISDDLGSAVANTWRVLPTDPVNAVAARDPRAAAGDDAIVVNQIFGLPVPALGAVVQIRWASATRVYVVYRFGILRHDESAGLWTTQVIPPPRTSGIPARSLLCTDLAPVLGTDDFYVTTLGDTEVLPTEPGETCWLYSIRAPAIVPAFHRTTLRRALDSLPPVVTLGPLDPAHAVCLDPDDSRIVYVGTTGGVWRGQRAIDGTHTWAPSMNGLPVTCISDIKIWKDAANTPGAPKLLRVATQSRGMWEMRLHGTDPTLEFAEPAQTFVRIHRRDDRRWARSPLADPRLRPAARDEVTYASPDVMIRPAPRLAAAPAIAFPLAAAEVLDSGSAGSHALWTFQTAFRWHFPSIRADGLWTDQLADLIELYRSGNVTLTAGNTVDRATWDAVVGGTRLNVNRALSVAVTDRWAVYETPWQNAGASAAVGTEVDLLELIQPLRVTSNIWRVHSEPCRVDVLLHHRDTRPLPVAGAYTVLLMKTSANSATLLAERASRFNPLHAWDGSTPVPAVVGWTAISAGATTVHRLPTTLDAFMPKAISVDVDLSAIPRGHHVMLMAICGGSAEVPPAPVGLTATSTLGDMVRAWPRAAMRLVQAVGSR